LKLAVQRFRELLPEQKKKKADAWRSKFVLARCFGALFALLSDTKTVEATSLLHAESHERIKTLSRGFHCLKLHEESCFQRRFSFSLGENFDRFAQLSRGLCAWKNFAVMAIRLRSQFPSTHCHHYDQPQHHHLNKYTNFSSSSSSSGNSSGSGSSSIPLQHAIWKLQKRSKSSRAIFKLLIRHGKLPLLHCIISLQKNVESKKQLRDRNVRVCDYKRHIWLKRVCISKFSDRFLDL
jgi:hypothetical protein